MFKLKHNAKWKRPNNDLQNTTQSTKDRTPRKERLNSDRRPQKWMTTETCTVQ